MIRQMLAATVIGSAFYLRKPVTFIRRLMSSEASRTTIPVDAHVFERIEKLKSLEVVVKAGRAERRYKVVKACRPDDLVFQSVAKGAPMHDNNILSRHIKPAARKVNLPWVNWQGLRR